MNLRILSKRTIKFFSNKNKPTTLKNVKTKTTP